jgi:aspartate aminotransferase
VGEGVHVDVGLGDGVGMIADRRLDDHRIAQLGSRAGRLGELGGELAEDEVLAAALDEAEAGDVPERGGAPVAEHDLPARGQREQLGELVAQRAHQVLHRGLAVRGAEIGVAGCGQRRDGFGANLGRPAAEAPVAGEQVGGETDCRGVQRSHCASMAAMVGTPQREWPNDRVSTRLAAIAESATLAVDAKAKALKAQGENVIGFGAGEPDFPTPEHIVEAAVAACRDPKNHRYTPAAGLPELRDAIAAKTLRDSGFECSASQVLVTNGGKQAVFTAFAALCDPGDEVICPAPYWTTYPESIALAGGVPVFVDTTEETGFRVTIDQLEAALTPRTKVLLFVSPDNPSGAVYPPEEVAAIGRWALERGLWVVTDEIYEHLTYGPHRFASMPTLVPELADHCVIVNGVAKTYAMTGWRVGWMIGPSDVIKASVNFQSHATSNVSNVAQVAALAAVSGDLSDVAMMRDAFERRGRLMHQMLSEIPGVTCLEPQGAFYCYRTCPGLLGRAAGRSGGDSSLELADLVLSEAKVAFVPGEAFGTPGYARFSFALGDADLEEGIRRFASLVVS